MTQSNTTLSEPATATAYCRLAAMKIGPTKLLLLQTVEDLSAVAMMKNAFQNDVPIEQFITKVNDWYADYRQHLN